MSTTSIAAPRSLFAVVVGEPLELAKAQPHQILLSTGSVALMGQFASHSRIVDPLVGYCIAIGVEWAYLRGLASDSRAGTRWGGALNWSAFGIVVLWGVLWCAQQFGVIDMAALGAGGWWLAAAHVVPIAWLSLCSAQCHRAAMVAERKSATAEQDRARAAAEQADATRQAWELAQAEEDRKLERWKDAQRLKVELKIAEKSADATMPKAMADAGIVPLATGKTALCKLCQKDVAWTSPSEAGTIRRWGCGPCRSTGKI